MLKYIIQPEKKYKGYTYKSRKIIADEKLLERLVKVPEAIVYSSWRSLAEQKVLVAEGKSKTIYSNHRRGMAVDCVNWKEVQDKMRKVGLINDISWDLNHFAFDGESKASKYETYDSLPKKLEEYKPKKEPVRIVKTLKAQTVVEDTKTVSSAIPSVSEPITTANIKVEYVSETKPEVETIKLSELPKIEPTLFQRFIELITNLIRK